MIENRLTAVQIAERLAAKAGTTVEQAMAMLRAQAELARDHAADGHMIPGLGRLVVAESPAREMVMRFGPDAGQIKRIPGKRLIKFRVSKKAKEFLVDPTMPLPDIFAEPELPPLTFSTATTVSAGTAALADLGSSLTLHDGSPATLTLHRFDDFWLPSGGVAAGDLLIGGAQAFDRKVPPGRYPLTLVVAHLGNDERIAFVILRFADAPAERWEAASLDDGDNTYSVDSGTGCFADAETIAMVNELLEADIDFDELVTSSMKPVYRDTRDWVHIGSPAGSIAVFSSGGGDGSYSSYFGLDADGRIVALLTDFNLVEWDRPPEEEPSDEEDVAD